MSLLGREAIYSSVFAFWQGLTLPSQGVPVPAFKTATRQLKTWDDVAAEDSPALLMQQREELSQIKRGFPSKWTLKVVLFVYVRTNAQSDSTQIPAQILNPLLDAIEDALVVDDPTTGCCTLGGLVSSCSIEGAIQIFQGNLGDQEVATVPISIVVNH